MALYGFGIYGIDEYGPAPVPPVPPVTIVSNEFRDYDEDRILGQVSPSTIRGAALGAVENGALSVPFAYYDEAGRFLGTVSKHIFELGVNSKVSNIPASENEETISNVAGRFTR